jgi:hypothetical protein
MESGLPYKFLQQKKIQFQLISHAFSCPSNVAPQVPLLTCHKLTEVVKTEHNFRGKLPQGLTINVHKSSDMRRNISLELSQSYCAKKIHQSSYRKCNENQKL